MAAFRLAYAVLLSLFLPFTSRRPFGAEFSELPVWEPRECAERRDYRLLAGGLALLLSRLPRRVAERDFAASMQACRSLRRQLRRRGGPVMLPAALLNELAHEIAQHADTATRQAARRCLQRATAA